MKIKNHPLKTGREVTLREVSYVNSFEGKTQK